MPKSNGKRITLVILACAVSMGLVSAVLKAGSYLVERECYVEVNGGEIAFVPRSAQYVRYNGQVRKIVKFATALSGEEEDCKCPKCCEGYCYVIIYTNGGSFISPIRILSVIWLSC